MDSTFKIQAQLNERSDENLQVSLKTDHLEWSCQLHPDHTSYNSAPTPEELMLSALVASTLIAMELYIERHELIHIKVRIEASLKLAIDQNRIRQVLIIEGSSEEEKEILLDIAQQTSVESLLGNNFEIMTSVAY